MNSVTWQTKVGWLTAKSSGDALTHLEFAREQQTKQSTDSLLNEAVRQLDLFFECKLRQFNLPLAPSGTAFQKQVWNALLEIPYGETWSYKQLAEFVDRPKGFQAVGQANGKNPIAIIIPCHRVVNADGGLGGYAGGLENKSRLLQLEGRTFA